MLMRMRAFLAYHAQAASTSFNLLCRKPLTTTMTVIVIAITLTLPALFWVFTDNVERLTVDWKQGGHISLFLKTSLTPAAEKELLAQVRAIATVGHVSIKSAKEGLAELQSQEGMEDIMHYLPENPLPAVIDVTPSLDINTPEKLETLFHQLAALPQVEQAKFDLQWVTRLHAILSFIAKIAEGLMILLASAVILIIGNTLRLAIQSRHEEIQVLKLIGATDPFIVRPFLYSGIWYGFIGALLAVLLVNIFMLSLGMAANNVAAAYQMHYSLIGLSLRQMLLLILSASLLGWIGARLSVRGQLAAIEPYH